MDPGRLYSGEDITVRSPRCIPWRLVAARGQPDQCPGVRRGVSGLPKVGANPSASRCSRAGFFALALQAQRPSPATPRRRGPRPRVQIFVLGLVQLTHGSTASPAVTAVFSAVLPQHLKVKASETLTVRMLRTACSAASLGCPGCRCLAPTWHTTTYLANLLGAAGRPSDIHSWQVASLLGWLGGRTPGAFSGVGSCGRLTRAKPQM